MLHGELLGKSLFSRLPYHDGGGGGRGRALTREVGGVGVLGVLAGGFSGVVTGGFTLAGGLSGVVTGGLCTADACSADTHNCLPSTDTSSKVSLKTASSCL
jgi:hypothetical protein